MIICAVCENQQAQGTACEVCGVPFPGASVAGAGHVDPPVEAMPGLEPTLQFTPESAPVPELTASSPCVWCGHQQASGTLCDRCGMQRHRGALPPDQDLNENGIPDRQEELTVPCGDCGMLGPAGGRCRACGAKMPTHSVL